MTRRVELRPAAKRDLVRLGKFIARMSVLAAERRVDALQAALAKLADMPFAGSPGPRDLRRIVIRIGRAKYVAHYRLTDHAVIITRIWHGRENRPR